MPSISRLNDFQAGNVILSSQVDDEFNQLVNTVNQLPDKDGSLQTNLNADMLDGKHMSINGGTDKIPLCDSTTIQVALNADLLDGQHASDIAAAAFDVGTAIPFYQSSPPSGWSELTKATDHVFGWKTGQAGGTKVAGSWTVGGLSVVINGHALTISEMASHTHGLNNHTHDMANHTHSPGSHTHDIGSYVVPYDIVTVQSGTGANVFKSLLGLPPDATRPIDGNSGTPSAVNTGVPSTNTTGGSLGNTTATGSGTAHDHTGTVSQNGTWRPPTAYLIICTKD